MTPPNLREVDCCIFCKYGLESFGCAIECDKYGIVRIYNICDDFKREE